MLVELPSISGRSIVGMIRNRVHECHKLGSERCDDCGVSVQSSARWARNGRLRDVDCFSYTIIVLRERNGKSYSFFLISGEKETFKIDGETDLL